MATNPDAVVQPIISQVPLLQAATPVGGFALDDSTGTIISWTVPNDGKLHSFSYYSVMDVTSAQTGGAIQAQFTPPAGGEQFAVIYPGALGAGVQFQVTGFLNVPVEAGTQVVIAQSSAQSAGAATLWAQIWGQ